MSMRFSKSLLVLLLLVALTSLGGCARAARDTTGFAVQNSASVDAPFEETWQTVKTVLREQGLDLYTRDKRGVFVAYSPMRRHFFQPRRTKYRIELAELSQNETRLYVETVRQVYGVTLLTYPNWHDRPATDESEAAEIINAVQAKVSGTPPVVEGDQTPS